MYDIRKLVIASIMVLVAAVIVVRLFCVQILDSSYKMSAESNSRRKVVQ